MKHLTEHEQIINKTYDMKLRISKLNTTEPWTMFELENAVKDLKVNKSRDAFDRINELFKDEVAGSDLKLAVLNLMKGRATFCCFT